jgi:hypothetical protein
LILQDDYRKVTFLNCLTGSREIGPVQIGLSEESSPDSAIWG